MIPGADTFIKKLRREGIPAALATIVAVDGYGQPRKTAALALADVEEVEVTEEITRGAADQRERALGEDLVLDVKPGPEPRTWSMTASE